MSEHERRTIALLLVAGSAGQTLARIANAYVTHYPGTRIVPVDVEALVYDAGRRDSIGYDGPGTLRTIIDPGASGGTGGLVSTLRRTPLMPRGLLDLAFGAVRAVRPVSRRYFDAARTLFAAERVDAVLTCNDVNTAMRSMLAAAHAAGIPTILVQEGAFCTIERRRKWLNEGIATCARRLGIWRDVPVRDSYGVFGHRAVLAASNDYVDRFDRAGVSRRSVHVTGIPRFDALAAAPSRSGADAVRRLVYLFQPFVRQGRVSDTVLPMLDALIDGVCMARERDRFDFAIKLHPRADPETIDRLIAHARFPIKLIPADVPMREVLASTDAVIGHYSTALAEALAVDIPMICVPVRAALFAEPEEAAKQRWFERSGVPTGTTPEAIARHVVQALGERRRNMPFETLQDETGPIDGRSTDRAVAVIAALLRQQP